MESDVKPLVEPAKDLIEKAIKKAEENITNIK